MNRRNLLTEPSGPRKPLPTQPAPHAILLGIQIVQYTLTRFSPNYNITYTDTYLVPPNTYLAHCVDEDGRRYEISVQEKPADRQGG